MADLLRDIFTDEVCNDGSAASSSSAAASSSRVNNPISGLIRQFIDTTRNQQFLNELDKSDDQFDAADTSVPPSLGGVSSSSAGSMPAIDPSIIASLTPAERLKISNRSQVMARQFFPDQGDDFIDNVIRTSLHIDPSQGSSGALHGSGAGMHSFLNARRDTASGTQYEDGIDMVASSSSSQYLVEDSDIDQHLHDGMSDFLDFQDIDSAYEKYLELMRENLSMEGIQKSTPAYEPAVPIGQNPYASQSGCYDIGMQLWRRGDVSKAILAFEAHVHQDPRNSDAWRMLGVCHAECDNDQSSIRALSHAIDADPQNLVALLELGVGYTNELNNMRALVFLRSWLSNHASYAHLVQSAEEGREGHLQDTLLNYFHFHQEVLDLYNSALEQAPRDADLHIVLGVLHNISKNYDQAIEHLKLALEQRPGDYSLWNKLGATLANSSSPKEAIDAYRSALQLKPNYVRAWINLGIAYANMRKHDEAVKFYLRALSMSPQSESVWEYLGMSFTCMDRADLAELCKHKDVDRFRDFMDF